MAVAAIDEEALRLAYNDHMSKIFDVLCTGVIANDVKDAHKRFMNAYRAAKAAHAQATIDIDAETDR